jgi:hypothetical protein
MAGHSVIKWKVILSQNGRSFCHKMAGHSHSYGQYAALAVITKNSRLYERVRKSLCLCRYPYVTALSIMTRSLVRISKKGAYG